ncbi:kinesin motor domain containing protein [Stylonychia lemnae]|uniref:Kinesin motor domain containing protein n=1 Tax=Stylonychia lemnae TaxID=5949 RepID=A0A078A244_STYLE|nr:kinesin motor domain containing protein [Stylonychia lemnae]|eukprot:CDW74824.1 kinesin motor domain containing protein [Stylonychia lemnae]
MNSQRGPPPTNIWPKTQPNQTISSYSGSLSQRGASTRAEWNKKTSIMSSKPFNQTRSIDNRQQTLLQKKIDLNNSSSNVNSLSTGQNFLFNTYSATGNQNSKHSLQSNDQNKVRNKSNKGWSNNLTHNISNNNNLFSQNQQNQQTSLMMKNFFLNNQSEPASNNKTLESSSSCSNLMLDSAILHTLQNNTQSLANDANQHHHQSQSQVFNELQNQLENFNAQRFQGKQRADLAQVLSNFAPPQTTKSSSNNHQSNKQNLNVTSTEMIPQQQKVSRLSCKLSFEDLQKQNRGHNQSIQSQSQIPSNLLSDSNANMKSLDQTINRELENQSDSVNESVIMFKQSTHETKSQDPTPKSISLSSYKQGSIQSHEKDSSVTISILTQKKESRNKMAQVYLSQQLSTDSSKIASDQKKREQVMSSNTLPTQLTTARGAQVGTSIDIKPALITSNKSKNKGSKKKKNLNTNNSGLVSNIAIGSKTPQEVFQYKLKNQQSTTLRIDTALKAVSTIMNSGQLTIPSSNNKSAQNQKKQSISSNHSQRVNLNQILNRPPITTTHNKLEILKGKGLGKSESQRQLFYTQKTQDTIHDSYDIIDTANCQFIYSTTNNLTNHIAPPNSDQLLTPETQQQKIPMEQMLQQEYQDKVKALDFELEHMKDHSQRIKVVSRFRPLNKLEREFKETYGGPKDEIIQFIDETKTVKISDSYTGHGNHLQFTFDHIFKQHTTQEEVFNLIGKETIEDIMEGYNGTIFAYGQTGSGKTFTMYGYDLFDEQLMGIVPRAARQIFQHIKTQDLEIEYQIRVQMVEIYKEQLRDLLHDSTDQPPELKIKEDPKRGTYVEGLNDVCIVSEEEIMTVLCTGETMRHVASTHLNQVSSRSHSICIIEVIQKFPNDSERRGVLNLVDLAGSERVSKSHAQGQALEEAKKINFSLSMLGKVINSLTKNAPYIPYRDSKLTRLLKESLGGNNKTSLIVACSPHHTNIEETISTLRFAQSAKFIQNKVKLNIKTSPEQLQLIIEQLKMELRNCKEEIFRLRITATAVGSNIQSSQKQITETQQALENDVGQEFQEYKMFKANGDLESQYNQAFDSEILRQDQERQILENKLKQTLHNRPHQSLLAKNYDVIETNNQRMQMLSLFSSEFSSIPGTGTPNFISPVKNYEIKLMQLINRNEDLEMKLKSKDKDIDALKSQKEDLQTKNTLLDDKVLNYKQKLLIAEKKIAEFESDKDLMLVNERKQTHRLEDFQSQIQVFNSQINCLERALEDSERTCQDLLREKQTLYQKSIKDFLNETIKLKRIKVSDALDNFINKPQTFTAQNVRKSYITQLDIINDFKNQENLVKSSEQLVSSLNEKDLLSRNLYCLETINALEDIPPDLTIYLLKQMLIEAALANHNLQRILAVNRWRQVMEYGKNKIKSNQCKIQEGTIQTLEEVLDRTRKTHDKLRARVDKLENHLFDNRNYYGDIVLLTEGNNPNPNQVPCAQTIAKDYLPSSNAHNIRNFNSLKDKTNQLNNHNQSLVSMLIQNQNSNQQPLNQKSRFIRTITNRTLGKAFNFIEKSPMSRGSIGANNQSILSHYYGQKHNANYKPGGTPLRSGGLNSPVFYNFQSPIRRQNTFNYNGYQPNQPQITSNLAAKNNNIVLLADDSSNQSNKALQEIIEYQSNQQNNINIVNNNLNHNSINNDQLTFEDAIVKFFNSSQIEGKNCQRTGLNPQYDMGQSEQKNGAQLSQEDLLKIEGLGSMQEIKDYIRAKFERSSQDNLQYSTSVHLNPLFSQYQNNAANQNNNTTNLLSSQVENNPQINSHTTNNNLYGQSKDYFDGQDPSGQKGVICSSSGNYHDNQRQEHVMTLASDYLITSNSVIGPNGLFSNQLGYGAGGNAHQNDYLDRLQEKIVQLQEEVETQKCRAEEHKKAYYESKRQIEMMRDLMEDKESKHNQILKSEVCQWENALNKFKEMSESELLKKQKEIQKLHEILAQWMENYQQLEHRQGGVSNQNLDQLLKETVSHRRKKSGLLVDLMKTPRHKRLSNFLPAIQSIDMKPPISSRNHRNGNGLTEVSSIQTLHPLNTYANMNPNLNQDFDKKVINGDNSPIAQEDSCFDFDQSNNQQLNLDDFERSHNLQSYASND